MSSCKNSNPEFGQPNPFQFESLTVELVKSQPFFFLFSTHGNRFCNFFIITQVELVEQE